MSFERSQINVLRQRLREPPRFMIVVAGPRQIGKTTLVRQALSGHPSTFAAADEPFPEVVDPFGGQAGTALTQARPGSSPSAEWLVRQWSQARTEAKRQAEGECYVLAIDEIQKIPRCSEVVKGLWDADRADNLPLHIVLLGSLPWLIEDHRLHGPRPPRRRRRSDPGDTHGELRSDVVKAGSDAARRARSCLLPWKRKAKSVFRVTDTDFRIDRTNLAENWREITVDDRRKVRRYFGEGG